MASDPRAARLTETHRIAQNRLAARIVAQMAAAWPLLDPEELDRTTERWLAVTVPLVRAQRITSARLAANYLAAFRMLELGSTAQFTPVLAETMPTEAIATSLVVTGPVAVKTHMRISPIIAKAMDIGNASAAGAAMRHTLGGGRQTISDTVAADPRALGWARATSGKTCHFCAMLASRGPVYSDDSVHFDAHDHCSCTAEPVYHRDAGWPAGSERFRALWDETTAGLSGADARNAFRQAVEAA